MDLFKESLKIKEFDMEAGVLERAIETARWLEKNHEIYCLSYPGTFSYSDAESKRYPNEIRVPPLTFTPALNNDLIEPGFFATVTGIPGLERLYENARRLGLKCYSNEPKAVPYSIFALPRIISNKNILFQFARSGWGSVWSSMLSGTPLVTPPFDKSDDFEIYFNNLTIELLGIGLVDRGESIEELGERFRKIRESSLKKREGILKRWQTLDGQSLAAAVFAEDFIKRHS